jgi:hypothetical protein
MVMPILERPLVAGANTTMKKFVLKRRPESDRHKNSERFKMRSLFLRKKRNELVSLEGLDSPHYNASACKTGPSFGAAPAQHLSTAFGGHPFPETVVSRSTQSAWLKWSFHVSTSLSN